MYFNSLLDSVILKLRIQKEHIKLFNNELKN